MTGLCKIAFCDRAAKAQGWCLMHYKRWRRRGGDPAARRPTSPVEARFWSKVNFNGPVPAYNPSLGNCWLWTASQGGGGYGRHDNQQAHRVAYELLIGPVPDGLELDHLCRVRACVQPTHTEPVTQRINNLRGFSPPALNARKTHCPQGHEYALNNLVRHGASRYRDCATCHRSRERDRARRNAPRPAEYYRQYRARKAAA